MVVHQVTRLLTKDGCQFFECLCMTPWLPCLLVKGNLECPDEGLSKSPDLVGRLLSWHLAVLRVKLRLP